MKLKKEENEEDIKNKIQMIDVIGMTLSDAKKLLKELNLEVEVCGDENENSIIVDQLPKSGITINEGTKITLYINN